MSRVQAILISTFVLSGCAADGSFSAEKLFTGLSQGVTNASTYYNNSAAQTQNNTTNLNPGLSGGQQMQCSPDGRGGYYCR